MEKSEISGIKIACVYIGTVVGAGFATGQEIVQFFVSFGLPGLWGILLSTLLFVLYGVLIMHLGAKFSAKSHLEILDGIKAKAPKQMMDVLIMISLFGALTAMMAGAGAVFAQQWGLPAILGSFFMGTVASLTVLRGFRGVISAVSAVVPFLLLSVFIIAGYTLLYGYGLFAFPPQAARERALMGNWFFAALLYAAYNILMSASVLAPLGGAAKNRRQIFYGAAWGGIGLGAASLFIYLAILSDFSGAGGREVPLLYLAGRISPLVTLAFTFVLLAEIYTTAVGALYGFSTRLAELGRGKTAGLICITAGLAFLASLFGFSNLVRYLYPIQGYGGLVFLILICYAGLKSWHLAKKKKRKKL